MAKHCSACHAENNDNAEFCKVCGAPLDGPAATTAGPATTATRCSECGFVNRPGLRYCAKCGINLNGAIAGSEALAAAPTDALSPYASPLDDTADPMARTEAVRGEPGSTLPPTSVGFGAPPAGSGPARSTWWPAVAVAIVVAIGIAWWFLRGSIPAGHVAASSSPSSVPTVKAVETPAPTAPPKPIASAPPAAPAATARAEAASAGIAALPTPSNTPPAAAADSGAVTSSAASDAAAATASSAAQSASVQAQEEKPRAPSHPRSSAAERKATREKAARDKAELEARARAAMADREDATSRQRTEAEAASRRVEEDRQRAQRQASVAAAPRTPTARSVKELCAGGNVISRAICESRACGNPEHAAEVVCAQVRANEERRRNPQD